MRDPFIFTSPLSREILEESIALVLEQDINLITETLDTAETVNMTGGDMFFVKNDEGLALHRPIYSPKLVSIPRVSGNLIKKIKHGLMVKKRMRLRFNKEIERLANAHKSESNT